MNRSRKGLEAARRILVVTKYRFIGDTLLAVPAIRAVAQAWPDAEITLVTGGKAHEMLLNCPFLHDIIEFDPYRPADKGLSRYFDLIKKLRARKFEIAIVLNRSFHSALTVRLGGVSVRAGWAGFHGRDFLLNRTCAYDANACEIDSYLDVVSAVSGDEHGHYDRSLALWLSPDEQNQAPHPVLERPRLVGIQPGATHAYKRWPAERYAQACSELVCGGHAAHLVLIGGPDEVATADEMLRHCSSGVRTKITSLVGQLSLRQTLSALSRLELFIANDTAIRHAAVALDTPSIALFGPTNAPKWGNACPPRHLVLTTPSQVVSDITLDEVMAASISILKMREVSAVEPVPVGASA